MTRRHLIWLGLLNAAAIVALSLASEALPREWLPVIVLGIVAAAGLIAKMFRLLPGFDRYVAWFDVVVGLVIFALAMLVLSHPDVLGHGLSVVIAWLSFVVLGLWAAVRAARNGRGGKR